MRNSNGSSVQTSDPLLRAAAALFLEVGFEQVSMEDVANAAGVSRATLYRRFERRDQLVAAVLLDRARPHLARLADVRHEHVDFEAQIEAAFLIGVLDMPNDPVLHGLFELGGRGRSIVLHAHDLRAAIAAALRPMLDRAIRAGQMRDGMDLDDVTAWLLREQFGFVEAGPWSPDGLRAQVRTFVLPVLLPPEREATAVEQRLDRIEELLEALLRSGPRPEGPPPRRGRPQPNR